MTFKLPKSVPAQKWRFPDKSIPPTLSYRLRLKTLAREYVAQVKPVPPLPVPDLQAHARDLIEREQLSTAYESYLAIMINNAVWEDSLAGIPYERRLLLLPKCLRREDTCPAQFDEFGLLCKSCGQCSLQDLQTEAEKLGYAVLIAEGSALVTAIIETGKIEAIVGVSCVSVLEKAFPFMEAAAIPGVAIPLLQGDCRDTTVDINWVWDVIHMTSEDRTRRLNLDAMKETVQGWFKKAHLEELMGPVQSPVDDIARYWLAKDGKRWRPFLAACTYHALQTEDQYKSLDSGLTEFPLFIKKIVVAVECFHKASLIHDDIADGDVHRYGEKTLHAEHGLPIALNVGDLLIGEGYRLIAESGHDPAVIMNMTRIAAEGQRLLCHGQGEELNWVKAPNPLKPQEVIEIFSKKTSPAFEVALALGAASASAPEKLFRVLKKYSQALGIAYQIRDDLDDDLELAQNKELRPSVLMAIALKKARGQDKLFLTHMFSKVNVTQIELETLKEVYQKLNITERITNLKDAYRDEAVQALADMDNPNLKGLLRRVIEKIFRTEDIEEWCREFETQHAANGETRKYFIV